MLVRFVLLAVLHASPDFHNPLLEKAVTQLRRFEEAQALATLERARGWKDNTIADLALIELYAGLAHAELHGEREATASFRIARKLDPTLSLPPGVAPRVVAWWDAAADVAPSPAPSVAPSVAPVVPVAPEPAPSATPVTPVEPTMIEPLTPTDRPGPLWPRYVAAGVGAAALVSLGVGIALGVQSSSLSGAAANEVVSVGAAEELHRRAIVSAQGANISYAVGGALVLVALAVWLFSPRYLRP